MIYSHFDLSTTNLISTFNPGIPTTIDELSSPQENAHLSPAASITDSKKNLASGKEDKMSALPALFFFHLLLSFKEAFQE